MASFTRRRNTRKSPASTSRPPVAPETTDDAAHRRQLIETATIEVVAMKSLETARADLPANAEISVTCSPLKGIEETQRLTEEFLAEGHRPIPHISARMVRDQNHTRELAAWCRSTGITKVFLVGGDADPPGGYFDAVQFLRDLLDTDHGLDAIGVTAYPDHHAFISDELLHGALHAKQDLLAEAGVEGWCSTQMCFDPDAITDWIANERSSGMTLPIHLGISGVVDRTKLMTTGLRIGVGQSLSYLKKNRQALTSMLTASDYDPNDLLIPLSHTLHANAVTGLHLYTFNQVRATEQWRQTVLASPSS